MRPYRRRHYLLDKGYQGRFVLSVVSIHAVMMTIAVLLFNFLSFREFERSTWRAHVAASTVGEIIRDYLVYANVFALVVAVAVVVVFSCIVLLRTEPPLLRLKKYISDAGDGNLNVRLQWMAYDEFRETADALNRMVDALRGRFRGVKARAEEVRRASDSLAFTLDKPALSAERCRILQEGVRSLKESLRAFEAAK